MPWSTNTRSFCGSLQRALLPKMRDIAIGYYAHHHGQGHITRARTIAAQLPYPMTIFSSIDSPSESPDSVSMRLLPPDTVEMPDAPDQPASDEIHRTDKVDAGSVREAAERRHALPHTRPDGSPRALHYAPTAMRGITERMGIMVDWFRDAWPCLLVVDVSVEVALLARLCSVPTVYVRQRGNRTDAPHALAYASAAALLAPYPETFSDRPVLDEWSDKTIFTGFISRYAADRDHTKALRNGGVQRTIVVLIGHGGTAITARALGEAARACPEWHWTVLGPVDRAEGLLLPANIAMLGVVADPAQWLATADVIVGSAGDSVVAEVAAFRQRFICFADPRPFDEQMATAQSLERHGLAVYCRHWPTAALWPVILSRAMALDPEQWDRFADTQGAQRAASAITRTAETAWQHLAPDGPRC